MWVSIMLMKVCSLFLLSTYPCYFFILGVVHISDDIEFHLDSPNQVTLTCISTGGPATTVTWTRNSTIIAEENIGTVVTDSAMATYEHIMTVNGRVEGLYTCSIANAIANVTSPELYVHGMTFQYSSKVSSVFIPLAPSAPSNVRVTQNGLNSVLVSWTAGDMSVTGYFISYSSEEGGETNSLSAEESDTNITMISELIVGATYTVNISANSSTLPSTVVTRHITLGNIHYDNNSYSDYNRAIVFCKTSQHLNIFLSIISYHGWK